MFELLFGKIIYVPEQAHPCMCKYFKQIHEWVILANIMHSD